MKQKLYSTLLLVMAMLCVGANTASAQANSVITYTATGVLNISGYFYNAEGDYVIYSEDFNDKTGEGTITFDGVVTSIGDGAFYECSNLSSITLPSSLQSIGEDAFYSCTNLTSITLPSSVQSIGNGAFYSCEALVFVYCKGQTPATLESDVFYDCDNLKAIVVPASTVDNYQDADGWSDFSEIIYSDNVTITYTASQKLNVSFEGASHSYDEETGTGIILLNDELTSIGQGAFRNCNNLTSITLPSSVTSIGDQAFYCCNNLTSVTLPDGLQSVGDNAFANTGITSPLYTTTLFVYMPTSSTGSYTIPSGITTICSGAFFSCTSLTSITLPDGLQSIGEEAFYNCTNLASISIPSSVTSVGDKAFANSGITSPLYSTTLFVYMPTSSTGSYTIPSGITTICSGAFTGCKSLTSITLPDGLQSIGESAFNSCTKLASISIPSSVTSIGESVFGNCSSLTSVSIPSSVTSIGVNAFYNCSSLASVSIPSGVTSIEIGAFRGCTTLASVSIPSSVTSIENYAFDGCSNLTHVTNYASTPQNIDDNVFSNYATLHVRTGCPEVYELSTGWNNFTNIVGGAEDVTLTDGEAYTLKNDMEEMDVTYQRTFANTTYNALYVPFAMEYSEWSAQADVYRLLNIFEEDTDDNGTIDKWVLKIVKLKEGESIKANTPYIIKPKATGEMTINLSNVTLAAAQEKSYWCASLDNKFVFTGTYAEKAIAADTYFAMSPDGGLQYTESTVTLNPQRWYMGIYNKDTDALVAPTTFNPQANPAKAIVISCDDEDVTGIENLTPALSEGEGVRKYMEDGKVVIVRNGKKYNVNGQVIE